MTSRNPSRTRAVALGTALLATGAALAAAAPSRAGSPGPSVAAGPAAYVWADQPTAADYAPSAAYSYNSAGETNTVERFGRGSYLVHFPRVSAADNGGTVDVTAYGWRSHPAVCKTSGWVRSSAGGTDVSVDCYTPSGKRIDARFSAVYAVPTVANVTYAFSDQLDSPTYTPSLFYSYNGWGGSVSGRHVATGSYVITFDGANTANFSGGTVKVTAYGSDNRECRVAYWTHDTSDVAVSVVCTRPDGVPADSRFTITYADHRNLVGRSDLNVGYAWIDEPSAPESTPSAAYQYQRPGGTIRVARPATGSYTLTLPRQASVGGNVQVTPYYSTAKCSVFRWFPVRTTQRIQVRCFDAAGVPRDSYFVVQWMTTV